MKFYIFTIICCVLLHLGTNHATSGISLFNTTLLMKTKVKPAETCVHVKRGENMTFVNKKGK